MTVVSRIGTISCVFFLASSLPALSQSVTDAHPSASRWVGRLPASVINGVNLYGDLGINTRYVSARGTYMPVVSFQWNLYNPVRALGLLSCVGGAANCQYTIPQSNMSVRNLFNFEFIQLHNTVSSYEFSKRIENNSVVASFCFTPDVRIDVSECYFKQEYPGYRHFASNVDMRDSLSAANFVAVNFERLKEQAILQRQPQAPSRDPFTLPGSCPSGTQKVWPTGRCVPL